MYSNSLSRSSSSICFLVITNSCDRCIYWVYFRIFATNYFNCLNKTITCEENHLGPTILRKFMELMAIYDVEHSNSNRIIEHEFWPLEEIDPKKAKFPCCLVWTPLPVVSWLAPFIGHVGICKEDGAILDFSGSNLINVDDFAYGAVGRYLQLDREQCCFPPNLGSHKCKHYYRHGEYGTAINWDDALLSSARHFEHKSYNLFTCNCHSFVANCLNRVCYGGSMNWNMVNVVALVFTKGQWADGWSILRSFLPFTVVGCLGVYAVGWPFLLGLLSFSLLLIGWFLIGTYCVKDLLDC